MGIKITLPLLVLLTSAGAAEASGLREAVARSKQTGLPMFVVGSSDS